MLHRISYISIHMHLQTLLPEFPVCSSILSYFISSYDSCKGIIFCNSKVKFFKHYLFLFLQWLVLEIRILFVTIMHVKSSLYPCSGQTMHRHRIIIWMQFTCIHSLKPCNWFTKKNAASKLICLTDIPLLDVD